jgi:SAM-dependent methyltransferase
VTHEPYYRGYDERYRRVYALGARTWRRPVVDDQLPRFVRACGLAPGDAIDLGCGEGIDAIRLAKRGWRVVGVDASPTAVRRARELASEKQVSVDFRAADVLHLAGLQAASFDLVLSIATLHMFVEAAHRRRYLREARRLLRPGGWLFIDVLARGRGRETRPVPAGEPIVYRISLGRHTRRVILPAVPSVRLSDADVRAALGDAGFLVRRLYRTGPPAQRRIIGWARKTGRCPP